MVKTMKLGRSLLAAAVWMSGLMACQTVLADGKDLLKVVPENTSAFLVVNSVKGATDSVKSFTDKIAPGLFPPGNPINDFLGESGLKDSFDETGAAAVLFADPQAGQQGVVLIIPVKDGKAALEGLKATEVEGEKGLYTATLKDESTYLATKDKYLVVGFGKQPVLDLLSATKNAAESLGAEQMTALAKNDLWIRGNMKQLVPLAQPFIGMAMMATAGQPGMEGVGQMVTEINKFMGELAFADLAFKLDAAGVRVSVFVQSQPKGLIPSYIASARKDKYEGSLLAGLPAVGKPILVAGNLQTWDEDLFAFGQKFNSIAMSMPQVESMMDKAAMEELLALQKEYGKLPQRSAVVVAALPADSDGIIAMGGLVVLRPSEKPVNIAELTEKTLKIYQKLYTDPQIVEVLKCVTFKANAEQIAGKPVHVISLDLKAVEELVGKTFKNAEDTEKDESDKTKEAFAKATEAIKKIVGSGGLSLRIIEVTPATVAITFGGGTKWAEEVVKAAGGTEAPLAKDSTLAKAAAELSANRTMECYLSLDNLMTLLKGIGEAVGEPCPLSLKPIGLLVACSTGLVGNDAVRFDLFIPSDLIAQLKELGDAIKGGNDAPQMPGGDF